MVRLFLGRIELPKPFMLERISYSYSCCFAYLRIAVVVHSGQMFFDTSSRFAFAPLMPFARLDEVSEVVFGLRSIGQPAMIICMFRSFDKS
jgi:hypothetical protein